MVAIFQENVFKTKCNVIICSGATAAVAMLLNQGEKTYLLVANAGDARVLLARENEMLQLTEDHVPDMEDERLRIEAQVR